MIQPAAKSILLNFFGRDKSNNIITRCRMIFFYFFKCIISFTSVTNNKRIEKKFSGRKMLFRNVYKYKPASICYNCLQKKHSKKSIVEVCIIVPCHLKTEQTT